ncbi:MAG TPA: LuxR family transcriptional regulator [Rhizomicrobium sp.]|jgi:LuxR family quorum sensing-dependent transcriptional regulator|nr:LuxR family transcriptional regulator [Rhizomicrobium sp.]
MLLTNSAFDLFDEIDRQDDIAGLTDSFQGLIGKFGMTHFMAGNPSQPGVARDDRLLATTWKSEWLSHWSDSQYLYVDPIARQLLSRNEPVRWGPNQGGMDATGARILEEACEYGMKCGYAVPVYSREGLIVAISMGAERYEIGKPEELCLRLASIYFHAKLERLRGKATPPRGGKLTPRERECLSWVAAGKTDWETSQILGIAEQTVHEYVQNALIKLNATTRAQAIAIAIFSKQISA